MIRNDLSNYVPVYGAGSKLVTELVRLVNTVNVYPQNAQAILDLFDADVVKVRAALTAAIPDPDAGV